MMKRLLFLLFLSVPVTNVFSQTINGQWHGYFNEGSNNISLFGGSTEYVLELMIKGDSVTGSSYTYFENRRFYVICNLNGSYNKRTKKIIVNETERVKGATPPDWSDCLQTHILHYEKQEGKEVLAGDWKTSPFNETKNGGCGWGGTTLSRRLVNNTFTFNKQSRTPAIKNPALPNKAFFEDKNKPEDKKPPVAKTKPKEQKPVKTVTPSIAKTNYAPVKNDITKATPPPVKNIEKKLEDKPAVVTSKSFEKRPSAIIKTIEIEKETFKVDLYDNGDIDGDTVSLFFNGKLILAHKKLTDKALSVTLDVDNAKDVNELVMYAENLGSIPPNTAVMVITDGDNRYEVRIASDLQKSGTIRFVHKPKATQ